MQPISNTFETRAALLGHDITAVKSGQEVQSFVHVADIDGLKALLYDGSTEDDNKLAATSLSDAEPSSAIETSGDLLQKMHSFLYRNGALTASEKETLNNTMFPMEAVATSASNKTIDSPLVLGTPQQPLIANYDTVTLNDTGCINITGTNAVITINKFIRMGNAPTTMGDINVLGINGANGINGQAGFTAQDAQAGGNGYPGGNGEYGSSGYNGLPSQPAIINITQSIQCSSPIVVFTSSGTGGNGGNGGKGGNGGNAGSGSSYPTWGGMGGIGGNGGNGGTAVDANGNIMVYVAETYINNVTSTSAIALAGSGGKGGAGGKSGTGPQTPPAGQDGVDGQPGATNGKPAQIFIRPY